MITMTEKRACRNFIQNPTEDPFDGYKLVPGKGTYISYVAMCAENGFDVDYMLDDDFINELFPTQKRSTSPPKTQKNLSPLKSKPVLPKPIQPNVNPGNLPSRSFSGKRSGQIEDVITSNAHTNCQQLINFYTDKYITPYGKNVCAGPTSYPKTGIEFYKIMENIGDYWDRNIACVMAGYKKVAMTDYSQFEPISAEDNKQYYKERPKDIELRKNALRCGVQKFQDNEGTEFWFYPEYKTNAEILIDHYNGIERFPHDLYDIIQALLLGYTDVSIISYQIHQGMVGELMSIIPWIHEIDENGETYTYKTINLNTPGSIPLIENYYKNLDLEDNIEEPDIAISKEWIIQRGGIVD